MRLRAHQFVSIFSRMKRSSSLLVAALFAVFTLPTIVLAQPFYKNTNQSRKFRSVIVGGSGNLFQSNSTTSFIGGGQSNRIVASTTNAVISGGFGNVVSNQVGFDESGTFGAVGGGFSNIVRGCGATVGGGRENTASAWASTVGGGQQNTASGEECATVAGGYQNTASGSAAAVSGGSYNTASGSLGAIGGGQSNVALGDWSTVSGGATNTANAWAAAVGGGSQNLASSFYATVPGGTRGKATNNGSFVWSGDDTEDTTSFGSYTFTVRCEGGARFYTANGTSIGPRLGPGDPQWVSTSDSNLKTKVSAVNTREVLAKLSRLPVTEWEYKTFPNRRFIGPMAQDFHAAFGLGSDDKTIGTLDTDGVIYAAIQGLVEELKDRDTAMVERDKLMAARDQTIEALKAKNDELSRSIEAINHRLNSMPPAH